MVERRGPNRPINAQKRPCLSCQGTMKFLEWYEVSLAGGTVRLPAWVCGNCGKEVFVRPGPLYNARQEASGRMPMRSEDPW
jgi:hypothetical protein